ncbi:type IV secretory system conjugative DNA transfer family protein [Streptomyces sp. NPDC102364]|uniref:type IV secretory system conjugative DNA transfer family protein n=1 Tax=Streptomyces sp. NPDC102364 TaxID=3366161 RepID=UPI0037F4D137
MSPPGASPLEDYLRDPQGTVHAVLDLIGRWGAQWGSAVAAAAIIGVAGAVASRFWWRHRRRCLLAVRARVISILPPPTADPNGAAALWSNLAGLLGTSQHRRIAGRAPHVVWEYSFDRDVVRLQLWVPGTVPPALLERAVEAAWPGAHTDTHTAGPALSRSPRTPKDRLIVAAGGELRLARSDALPLRSDFPDDPIRALFGAAADLAQHEQAVVQILARPATRRRTRQAHRAARHVGAGRSPHRIGRLLDLLTPGPGARSRTGPKAPDRQAALVASAQDRAIVTKQRGALYETLIRYGITASVSAKSSAGDRARVMGRLRGRGHAIAGAFAPFTEHNHLRRVRLRRPLPRVSERRLDRGDLLSVSELSTLAHLPWDQAVAGLQRAGARAVFPPPGVPAAGAAVRPLGRTDSGPPRPVGLWVADARHHLHVLGATGAGKSELLARMALADAEAGRGVVVIDPKGDLVTDVLARLPENLGPKVALFDADSTERPPVLNPLEGEDAAHTVDDVVSVFSRVYAASWGPRTDDILRAGLLTLRMLPGTPTLTDLPRLLSVTPFRRHVVAQVSDDLLRGFWSWYDALSEAGRGHVAAPLMNKLRAFLLRPFVRAAMASGPSTVDMGRILDGGICLVRIARDSLGAETSRLIGSLVVARAWQAATHRAHLPAARRRDASLYIDEAHTFLNLPYAMEDLLAEARGYRLSLTLAHQYLRQLPRDLAEGVSANARTKVFFNASPEDARHLALHTGPQLTDHDLSHLDVFHIAVRPVVHGAELPAFTAVTQKLPPPIPGRADAIRRAARRNAPPSHAPQPFIPPPGSTPTDPRRAH